MLFFLLQGYSEKLEERREGTHFWWQNSQRQGLSGEGSSHFRPQNEKQKQPDTETVNGPLEQAWKLDYRPACFRYGQQDTLKDTKLDYF